MNARKAEEEYRRLEHLTLSGTLYRQEEEMRRNEQEARERRLGIREHDQSLEKVEAQTSGESGGVVNVFTDTSSGCGVGGNGKSYHEWNKIILNDTSSSSSSGMGIPGRVSIGSSLGSLVFQCRERLSWGVDDALPGLEGVVDPPTEALSALENQAAQATSNAYSARNSHATTAAAAAAAAAAGVIWDYFIPLGVGFAIPTYSATAISVARNFSGPARLAARLGFDLFETLIMFSYY